MAAAMTLHEPAQVATHRSHTCVPPEKCNWCVKCGAHVVHEEIPDDTEHCECRRNAFRPCSCPCHAPAAIV